MKLTDTAKLVTTQPIRKSCSHHTEETLRGYAVACEKVGLTDGCSSAQY